MRILLSAPWVRALQVYRRFTAAASLRAAWGLQQTLKELDRSGPKPSYPREIAARSSKALPWSRTLTSSARVDHVRLPRFAGVAAVAPLQRHKTRVRRPPAATRRVGALAGQQGRARLPRACRRPSTRRIGGRGSEGSESPLDGKRSLPGYLPHASEPSIAAGLPERTSLPPPCSYLVGYRRPIVLRGPSSVVLILATCWAVNMNIAASST